MFNLALYDPIRTLAPRRGFLSHFFGPDIFRGLEEENHVFAAKVDITEDEKAYTLTAELPGFSREEIKVEFEEGRLSLRAEHKEEKEEKKENYHLKERVSGTFVRTFTLPKDVDHEKIEAAMENGVLTVTLLKSEETKPKQIEVKVN